MTSDRPTDAIERCIADAHLYRAYDNQDVTIIESARAQLAALTAKVAELRRMLKHAAAGTSSRGNCDECEAIRRECSQ